MPGRIVDFGSNTVCRPARDDERSVMQSFAAHAAHCARCDDPFRVYLHGGTLCDRGHAYARDVAQYVYSKAGKAYSVVDRNATDARVQIEIPAKCDAIRGLLKAVDQGLKVRSQNRPPSALKPVVVSHDRTYPVPERRLLPTERRDGYDVLEVSPRRRDERKRTEGGGDRDRRRETIYVPTSSSSGKGSLYDKDAEERRRRRQSQGEPVIVYAEPRRRKEQYYR